MKIKQDPVTGLWCREDGAVLIPPVKHSKFKKFRWTFGYKLSKGYRRVGHCGKYYEVHQMVCRAFHNLPPVDKPFVDHINRIRDDNRPSNLRWVDYKENNNNTSRVDQSLGKYSVRACEDKRTWNRAYWADKYAEKKAQGLTWKKGSDGKYGWYPIKRS